MPLRPVCRAGQQRGAGYQHGRRAFAAGNGEPAGENPLAFWLHTVLHDVETEDSITIK